MLFVLNNFVLNRLTLVTQAIVRWNAATALRTPVRVSFVFDLLTFVA